MGRQQVIKYMDMLARSSGGHRYAAVAKTAFLRGDLNQVNTALARMGVLFYRVGGEIERRRGATAGYQVRNLPKKPGTHTAHDKGSAVFMPEFEGPVPSEGPRFIRTPQGNFPLNEEARKQWNAEPRKPCWRFW
ncbi:hypothetical protein [Glutamicibacter ardleyensis]|uniref:hypothetical protein n=1 Tax=Glutamicibacter ardleyensis TaxID=225894 RepID=UPI003FCF6926